MSADQNDHLSAFESQTSAVAVSHFCFRRPDWPLLLSCFACLWHECCEAGGDESELAGSEALLVFAKSWREQNGIAPHPFVLLADYRGSFSRKVPRIYKKRVPAAASTIDVQVALVALVRRGD